MDLSRIDLNLLVAFDALVTERHVTRAAARLSIGQSAMSATLKRLRRLFADPILVRQGRELVVSPLAERLTEPVRDILASISSLVTQRDVFDPETTRHTFRIMASDYITMIFLHPLLERLADEAPNVTLNIFPIGEDPGGHLWRSDVDLLIYPREVFPEIDRFTSVELFSDEYVCAVDGANSDVGESMSLEQFQSQPYMATLHGDQPSFADLQLEAQGIRVDSQIRANSIMAPFILRGTRYMTLILGHLARYAEKEVNLRYFRPPMTIPPVTEMMVWTQRSTDDPAHQWLRARLHQLVTQLGI